MKKKGDRTMVRKNEGAAQSLPLEQEPSTGLATTPQAALAPAGSDAALNALLDQFDFSNDGLEAVDKEDFRLPVIVWNLKGKDERANKMRSLDEYYDTLNERYYKQLHCAFIHLTKTNSFARFDEARNETIIHCTSYDRVVGRLRTRHPDIPTLAEGTERKCAECPDYQWRKNEKGKNTKNCNVVYGVFGVMLDDQLHPTDGFMIRFKRTGLQPFQQYMQRHHIGKRRIGMDLRNWPLWMFEVTMTLQVDKGGNFAVPVIEKGRELPVETLRALAEQARYFADVGDEATRAAEAQETRHEAAEPMGGGAAAGGATVTSDDFTS